MTFWLVVMGLMFLGSGDSDATVLTGGDLSAGFAEGQEWMGVYHDGRKLGYVHSTTRRDSDRLNLFQESHLEIQLGGTRQRIVTELSVTLGESFGLINFDFQLETEVLKMQASGKMEGPRLVVRVTLGDQTSRRVWTLEEPPLFDLAVPKILAQHDLRPGRRFQLTLFDPQSMSNQPALIEVIGREAVPVKGVLVPAVRLKRTSAGLSTDTWISERGEVLKQEHAIGLVLRREYREQAMRKGAPAGTDPSSLRRLMRDLVPDSGEGEAEEGGE